MAEIEKPALSATSTSPKRSGHHNIPKSGVPQYGTSICFHTLTPPNVAVVGGCPACRLVYYD
ncbi:uncharacterized protein LOC143224650 isoform X2 [Tachypleus tridentatus]|uniref:uncharacterized protein LOC143224649 isoform X2 n=1 Tax=Tachypleus tridentatus TaxID=6853 RepID=UPI003FD2AC3E